MIGKENLFSRLKSLLASLDSAQRSMAVDSAEVELQELQHVFALLVLGQAVGLPSPPAHLSFELLPDMEEELRILLGRIETAQAPLSLLYSSLSVD